MKSIPIFILWKWRSGTYRHQFEAEHVNGVVEMLMTHGVPRDHIICVTDDPTGVDCATFPLWDDFDDLPNPSGKKLPSCYRRLRLLDPKIQQQMGIRPGWQICSLDLDVIIVKDFLPLFRRGQTFVGWRVWTIHKITMLNGSIWMFKAGEWSSLWEKFDPIRSPRDAVEAGYQGSDQGYLSLSLMRDKRLGHWTTMEHGLTTYRQIHARRLIPPWCRVVFFNGRRKPWDKSVVSASPWIRRFSPWGRPPCQT